MTLRSRRSALAASRYIRVIMQLPQPPLTQLYLLRNLAQVRPDLDHQPPSHTLTCKFSSRQCKCKPNACLHTTSPSFRYAQFFNTFPAKQVQNTYSRNCGYTASNPGRLVTLVLRAVKAIRSFPKNASVPSN
jgi:hypothetical protein